MTEKNFDLFDCIREETGCTYISDLSLAAK